MKMLTIVLAIIISILSIKASDFECLVSKSKIQYNSTDFYYYPVNIFASKSVFEQTRDHAVPCTAVDGVSNATHHLCPDDRSLCPLTKENIKESLYRTTLNARSSLCILKEKLLNKSEIVNVYVAGGSVTAGVMAAGCCPAAGCNPLDLNTLPCSWSNRLVEWMNATYPAHVKYFDMTGHGRNSVLMVDDLAGAMKKLKVKEFTSSDLILLDHSVNDNCYYGFAIEHGLEMLIRKIYHRSQLHSFPTIVILDADPNPRRGFKSLPYSLVYEKVGKYYDIPVWSYRDSVLSNFSNVNQSDYVNYINMERNFVGGTHPGWPVHLFMADMYAGLLVSETDELCNIDNVENKARYEAQLKLRERTFADLPVALSANATHMCDNELLSLSYDNVKQNLSPVGSYRFEPAVGGWNLTVDKVGRMGGFIVDHASNEGDKVVFSMNITTKEFIEKKMKFQIVIHYLRSYENAGLVALTLCDKASINGGKREKNLDALWVDYHTHRYSLPDKWSPQLDYFSYTMCNNFTEERPTIALSFLNKKDKKRGNQKFKLLNIKVCRLDD